MAAAKELLYRGKPLRRYEDTVIYGNPDDRYFVVMKILETNKIKDLDVATKVEVSLERTEAGASGRSRVEKKSEKKSLYSAMDLGSVWLERALASAQ